MPHFLRTVLRIRDVTGARERLFALPQVTFHPLSLLSAPGELILCPWIPLGSVSGGAPEGHLRDRGEVKVSVPLPPPQGGLGLALTLD